MVLVWRCNIHHDGLLSEDTPGFFFSLFFFTPAALLAERLFCMNFVLLPRGDCDFEKCLYELVTQIWAQHPGTTLVSDT